MFTGNGYSIDFDVVDTKGYGHVHAGLKGQGLVRRKYRIVFIVYIYIDVFLPQLTVGVAEPQVNQVMSSF